MAATFSTFASTVQGETAFTVLAAARRLLAAGKDVIELEIGDSPFPTSPAALAAGVRAIGAGHTHYAASLGLPNFRAAAAEYVRRQYGLPVTADHVVAGPGAKIFEQFFCEAFVNPGDGVLVFSPHFPTYPANIQRRGARMVVSPLRAAHDFRPDLEDVERLLAADPSPTAIFLNSPHNPTGGVATIDDLAGLAGLIRGRDVAVFSDEPYDAMVWRGRHRTLLSQPGMLDQCVAAYTFSKSFSMSGWRLGFAVSSPATIEVLGTLTNPALSCVPPFTLDAPVPRGELVVPDHEDLLARQRSERLVDGRPRRPYRHVPQADDHVVVADRLAPSLEQRSPHPLDAPEGTVEAPDDVGVIEVQVRPDPGSRRLAGAQPAAPVAVHPLQHLHALPFVGVSAHQAADEFGPIRGIERSWCHRRSSSRPSRRPVTSPRPGLELCGRAGVGADLIRLLPIRQAPPTCLPATPIYFGVNWIMPKSVAQPATPEHLQVRRPELGLLLGWVPLVRRSPTFVWRWPPRRE